MFSVLGGFGHRQILYDHLQFTDSTQRYFVYKAQLSADH